MVRTLEVDEHRFQPPLKSNYPLTIFFISANQRVYSRWYQGPYISIRSWWCMKMSGVQPKSSGPFIPQPCMWLSKQPVVRTKMQRCISLGLASLFLTSYLRIVTCYLSPCQEKCDKCWQIFKTDKQAPHTALYADFAGLTNQSSILGPGECLAAKTANEKGNVNIYGPKANELVWGQSKFNLSDESHTYLSISDLYMNLNKAKNTWGKGLRLECIFTSHRFWV